MSTYKSIRDISAELLNTFKTAGVKLTEGQKADIDGFIKTIEHKINETKLNTIRATKKIVEKNSEEEFKKVFDQIFENLSKHSQLCEKLKTRATQINESKKMAKTLDSYLDLHIKEAMPQEKIVNEAKLKKLQTLVESMKDMLLISDDDVSSKKKEIAKKYAEKESVLSKEISSLKKKLNESMTRELKMKQEAEAVKAAKLLNEKTDDLPVYEARRIRKKLAGASCSEIESKFRKIYEEVEKELAGESQKQEKSLEEEINGIIAKDETKEILEKNCDKTPKTNKELPVEDSKEVLNEEDDDEEQLTESEKINPDWVANWIGMVDSSKTYRL